MRLKGVIAVFPIFCVGLFLILSREVSAVDGICVDRVTGAPCSGGGGGGGGNGGGYYYTPPARDYEAERREREAREEAERQRRKRLEEERAAEEKQKQEEFDRKKKAALQGMKGLSTGTPRLKGNTPTFGIKGVGDPGIENKGRDDSPREVRTAWQQLNCAVELSGIAMEKISGGATDFDDALYLSQEALNALQGSPKGVECEKAKDPWKPYGQTELEGGKALLQKVIQNNLEQINVIVKADKELDEHKKKEAEVKDRVEKLKQESAELKKEGQLKKEQKKEKPLPPPQEKKKGGDDAIAKYEEQKAFQKQEEEKIKEVARKQKEKQEAYEKALAAMRELQRVINQENGRKKGATDKLQENKAKVGEIVRQLQVNTGGR